MFGRRHESRDGARSGGPAAAVLRRARRDVGRRDGRCADGPARRTDGHHHPFAVVARAARRTVDAIFEDAAGTIWAGGTAGLWRIREGHVEQLGEREGLPAQRVMAITQSLDGDLWLAVDRGPRYPGRRAALIRLNPSDFDRATAGDAPVAGYKIYDADERPGRFPARRYRGAVERRHAVVRHSAAVLSVVDPRHVSAERRAAPARIAGVTVDDRPVTSAGAGVAPSRHAQDPDRLHRASARGAKTDSLPLPSRRIRS